MDKINMKSKRKHRKVLEETTLMRKSKQKTQINEDEEM
jgi:hypothetical protein